MISKFVANYSSKLGEGRGDAISRCNHSKAKLKLAA